MATVDNDGCKTRVTQSALHLSCTLDVGADGLCTVAELPFAIHKALMEVLDQVVALETRSVRCRPRSAYPTDPERQAAPRLGRSILTAAIRCVDL